jgi:hypothetical protein
MESVRVESNVRCELCEKEMEDNQIQFTEYAHCPTSPSHLNPCHAKCMAEASTLAGINPFVCNTCNQIMVLPQTSPLGEISLKDKEETTYEVMCKYTARECVIEMLGNWCWWTALCIDLIIMSFSLFFTQFPTNPTATTMSITASIIGGILMFGSLVCGIVTLTRLSMAMVSIEYSTVDGGGKMTAELYTQKNATEWSYALARTIGFFFAIIMSMVLRPNEPSLANYMLLMSSGIVAFEAVSCINNVFFKSNMGIIRRQMWRWASAWISLAHVESKIKQYKDIKVDDHDAQSDIYKCHETRTEPVDLHVALNYSLFNNMALKLQDGAHCKEEELSFGGWLYSSRGTVFWG